MACWWIYIDTLLHCSFQLCLCHCTYLQTSLFIFLLAQKIFVFGHHQTQKKFFSSSFSSKMAGTPMAYNSSRVKSSSLKWLYFCSACPSSSNRLNAWIMFGLSISTITSWSGKCWSYHLSLTHLLHRCIPQYNIASHDIYLWQMLHVSIQWC